jgi:magnesium transporter
VNWINVQGFGDEGLLRSIGDVFGIHPLAMADVVNVPQRPKIDSYDDRHLIVLRMARHLEAQVDLQQVSLVFGPSWVVTFEEHAIGNPEPATLARTHAVRRLLLLLGRIQRQQRDALILLARDEHDAFGEKVRPYLRDVADHAIHVLDSIEIFREMTIGVIDIYLSSVGNRTNDVMKTLTVIASLFIPLTFIAGVYGMNFEYMPELRWRWATPGPGRSC